MKKLSILIGVLTLIATVTMIQAARATYFTTASPDRATYLAGQTGYILATIFNDKSDVIRVTQLSATINYYFADGTIYVQTFYYPAGNLPDEIPAGQSKTYQIPISLPTNIAPGYINPLIQAATQLYHPQDGTWTNSDHPSYTNMKLYVESPYKQLYDNSQQQLQQEQSANTNLTNTMIMLSVTTIVFAAAAGFLVFMLFSRRPKPAAQS